MKPLGHQGINNEFDLTLKAAYSNLETYETGHTNNLDTIH